MTNLNGTKANGTTTQTPSSGDLLPGIYVPTVAFFETGTEAVDLPTVKKHAIRLAKAGVTGLVTHGSNGEAVHLDHSERISINSATRQALDSIGRADMPLVVGCGAQSTKETIQLCVEAAESGGNYALVLPPSYYGSLLNSNLLLEHFRLVADASPVPLLIYNFPSAAGGLDLTSDQILLLSQHHNIVGVKLTCGNTGKLARIAAGAKSTFLTMGGSADFILPTLVVGGHGIIAGVANLAPKTCVEIMKLYEQGNVIKARELQAVVARGDWVAIKGGFIAVKSGLDIYHGYGGAPRRPCVTPEKLELVALKAEFEEMMALERSFDSSI